MSRKLKYYKSVLYLYVTLEMAEIVTNFTSRFRLPIKAGILKKSSYCSFLKNFLLGDIKE
jgi:hypothetical protein